MNKHKKTRLALAVFYMGILFVTGCFPEDSLEWSADGSIGLMRANKALYLVDGESGALTEVAKGGVQPWPDISDNGKWIVYSEELQCKSLAEGLKLLPANQVKRIKTHAEWMKKDIMVNGLRNGKLPQLLGKDLEYAEEYLDWVVCYLCETADANFLGKLTDEIISEGKNKKLTYCRVVMAQCGQLNDKKIVATSVTTIFKTTFSPDFKHIAYLMVNPERSGGDDIPDKMSYQLYIASPEHKIAAMQIFTDVAFGYDWREDSRAIAFMHGEMQDDSPSIGALREVEVADSNGVLLARTLDVAQGALATHTCQGHVQEPVGTLFYPWSKVEYGPGGRIFFASLALSLPAVKHDDPKLSLFCYDPITKAVSNVLPLDLSDYIRETMPAYQFSLSQDGKTVLLPLKKNRFVIYKLGSTSAEWPINEDEGFGEDAVLELAPAWKGNDEISCLVSEDFLARQGVEKPSRKEIVVLRTNGEFKRVLSKNWPNSLQSKTTEKIAPAVPIEQLIQ